MRTSVYALRIGWVKILVPFVFAYYPVILIVEESGVAFEPGPFLSILFRLIVVIYLVSSAVIAFDRRRLPTWKIAVRIGLALLIIVINPMVHWTATAITAVLIGWHTITFRKV